MSSCRKRKLVDRVLGGDVPESLRKIIAYGNQLNGMKHLYDKGKLKISKEEGERLKRAYATIENIMASRGVELDYIPGKRVEVYIDQHKKRYEIR